METEGFVLYFGLTRSTHLFLCRDEDLQLVCTQLKEDLTELLSELRQLTLLKSGPSVWTSALYNPIRQQLILAEWILKVLISLEFIENM